MVRVKTERGLTFDATQWTGDKETLPDWAQQYEVETLRFYGNALCVGPYYVKPGSWVLKGDERGDIFPVPDDMFAKIYEPVSETDTLA